jgi:hypothetical protein
MNTLRIPAPGVPPRWCLFNGLVGEGVVHWPTVFSVGLLPVIVLAYAWLAGSEEQRMLEQLGEQYRTYQRRVPMFLPRMGQWRELVERSSGAGDNGDQLNR